MPGVIDIFEKRSMTNAINKTIALEPFFMNMFFKRKEMHANERIDVEIYKGIDGYAQYVNRNTPEAKPVKKGSQKWETVSLPRTYEKKVFTAQELADYHSIGSIYTENPAERTKAANEWTLREVAQLKERVLRTSELAAATIMSTGKYEVDLPDVKFDFDFKFTSDQLPTLTTKWDASTGANPLKNLRDWKRKIMAKTGINPNILILGSDAADAFLDNETVKKALDNNNYKVGSLDLSGDATQAGIYYGRIAGVDIYEYNQQYSVINSSGNLEVKDMIDKKKAILSVKGHDTFRLHKGPAYRIKGTDGLSVIMGDYLLEPKVIDDYILEWKCEQKSMPIIHMPELIISATVL